MHKFGAHILSWAETGFMPGPLLPMMWPLKSVQLPTPAVFIFCCNVQLKIKDEHKESTHDSRQLSQGK
jgi:hypothetical protein